MWHKLEAAKAEIRDLAEEFQTEREDMLDTTRELDKQSKLLAMMLDLFVPKEERDRLEARAIWDEETGEWSLHRLELAGNRLRVRRPPSTLSPAFTALYATLPMPQARPVTQHSILRAQTDSDPRFRADNIATMDLEWGNFAAVRGSVLTLALATRSPSALSMRSRLAVGPLNVFAPRRRPPNRARALPPSLLSRPPTSSRL